MTTLKNSKILLVSLLIIAIVALAGCAGYARNPARYDHSIDRYNREMTRGNFGVGVGDGYNMNRPNDGVRNQTPYNVNRNNMSSPAHRGLTDGAINNNR